MSLEDDTSIVHPRSITVDDITVVARLPRGTHVPDQYERQALALTLGPHVLALVDSGRLAVRIGPDRARYWRPAGWRSLTVEQQTRRVLDMLNGAPRWDAA